MPKFQSALWSNAGLLLSGNVAGSLIGIAVMAISARALDPVEFGQLAMFAAGYQLCARIIVVQTGNAFIKFGVGGLIATTPGNYTRQAGALARWCLRLEWGTAIAGAVVYAMGLAALSWFLGQPLTAGKVTGGLMFVAPLLVNVGSLSAGVLRLGGHFGYVAAHPVVSNLAKLAGCVFLWLNESAAGIIGFAAAWAFGEFAGLIYVGIAAFLVWRSRDLALDSRAGLSIDLEYPGLRTFVAAGVAHNAVKSMVREGDVLLVGGLGGPAAAGAYRLVKQIGSVLGRTVEPLQQAMFPDLARLAARNARQEIRKILSRISATTAVAFVALWLIFVISGKLLITVVLGPEYVDIYWPTLCYLAGTALAMAGIGLHPAALALGLPLESFRILVFSAAFYGISLILLVPHLGVLGAAISYVAFYVLWTVQFVLRLRTHLPH